MSILKKIFGTSENEFSIGLGANRVRLINNSKTLEIKDKDSVVIPLAIPQIALPSTLTDKTTPVDADLIPIGDSAASGIWKKLTWANIKTALNSLYMALVSPGTSGNVLTSNGSIWVSQAAASGGNAIYGDGSDGNVTISSNTTLSRDMYYANLTINSGIVLSTAGYRIFVSGTLTNNGTIRRNGNAGGTENEGGALGPGTIGGAGKGAGNSAATNMTVSLGGAGGAGGANGSYYEAGTVTAPMASQGAIRSIPDALHACTFGRGAINLIQGGSGGGGSANILQGKGGGGGGVIMIAAKTLTNTSGIIEANGGAGGDGDTSDNSCGGGGGGGGVVILVYNTLNAGTEQASGGAGGAKNGTGVAGSTGSAGTVIKISNN